MFMVHVESRTFRGYRHTQGKLYGAHIGAGYSTLLASAQTLIHQKSKASGWYWPLAESTDQCLWSCVRWMSQHCIDCGILSRAVLCNTCIIQTNPLLLHCQACADTHRDNFKLSVDWSCLVSQSLTRTYCVENAWFLTSQNSCEPLLDA